MRTVAKLFLLFTIVSTVELYLLLKIGELTSWWVTVALIFGPGLVGAWLSKREGARAFREVRAALSLQREPTGAILDGAIVLVAAVLLISPGVLTDLTGLFLLVPPVRRVAREYLRSRVMRAVDRRLASGSFHIGDLGRFATGDPAYEVIDADDIPKRP
jgi:UPF0716 protein FxsA